jgi:hypothetical protein
MENITPNCRYTAHQVLLRYYANKVSLVGYSCQTRKRKLYSILTVAAKRKASTWRMKEMRYCDIF